MAAQRMQQLPGRRPGRRVPKPHRRVFTRGGDPATVRADRHAEDVPGVAAEGLHLLEGARVPYLDGVLLATRDQIPVVRGESHPVRGPAEAMRHLQRFLALAQAVWVPL